MMANRPDYSPDVPLTAKEVAEVRLRYAQLSRPGLRDAYTEALERCRLDGRGRALHARTCATEPPGTALAARAEILAGPRR